MEEVRISAIALRTELGMGQSAFYKLTHKLGVKSGREGYDIKVANLIREAAAKRRHWGKKGSSSTLYRVSVNEGYGYFVRHVALTKKKAAELVEDYRRQGLSAIMKSCS